MWRREPRIQLSPLARSFRPSPVDCWVFPHGIPALGSAWRRSLISSFIVDPATATARPFPQNRLVVALAALAPNDSTWLAAHLVRRDLALGHVLAAAGETFGAIYFPVTAVISVIARMTDGGAAEVGTVGNEGVVGVSALLDALPAPHETVAQIPGVVMAIDAAIMRDGMEERPAVRKLMHRYVHEYLTQVAQTAACNRLHDVEERCARWLLMTHDRVGQADEFPLTQAYLAIMLGVRRAGVTVAAGALQSAGLITYHRGGIRVVDRTGLEAAACECYSVVRREFDRPIA